MKRITSAAGLVLRLTWVRMLGCFAFIGAAQWLCCLHSADSTQALEYLLDDLPALIGRLGSGGLMLALYYTLRSGKGSRITYTLRRLSLSETAVTAVWTMVLAGYFLLYWAFQLGMVFLMYGHYTDQFGGSGNLLFVVSMRSGYFHYLLPLYEPWGFIRNAVMCVGFASFAALGARNDRNGRWNPLCLAFLMLLAWGMLTPGDVASQWQDIAVTVIALVCVLWDWVWTERWMRSEEN